MASSNLSPQELQQNRGPALLVTHITVYSIAIIAVALRLFTRKLTNNYFWWDDLFIAIALVCASAVFAIIIIWLENGFGQHIQVAAAEHPNGPTAILKGFFGEDFVYTLTIGFTKLSILAFYWRIFAVTSIRKPIYVVTAIVVAWMISVLFTSGFSCVPINALWDLSVKGKCINLVKFYIGNTIPNVITDIILLCLPLPYIWRLQIPNTQKALVLGAFVFGGFTCIVSIIRMVYVVRLQLNDLTWDAAIFTLWTGLETYCAIICACLPSLRPLLRLFRGQAVTKAGGHSSGKSSRGFAHTAPPIWSGQAKRSGPSRAEEGSFHPLQDNGSLQQDSWATASATAPSGYLDDTPSEPFASDNVEMERIRKDRIQVETDIAWHTGKPSP